MKTAIEKNKDSSDQVNTKLVIGVLVVIVLVVLSFYFFHFHHGFAQINETWGQFGDYVGGILNPVIAAFALYLIAKSYELQKRELEATRILLNVSTKAQEKQVKLAAFTALLNSNLMRISALVSEKTSLLQATFSEPEFRNHAHATQYKTEQDIIKQRIIEIDSEATELINKNNSLEEQIRRFCNYP